MLYDETSGQIGTLWYEFTERDVMEITELEARSTARGGSGTAWLVQDTRSPYT